MIEEAGASYAGWCWSAAHGAMIPNAPASGVIPGKEKHSQDPPGGGSRRGTGSAPDSARRRWASEEG